MIFICYWIELVNFHSDLDELFEKSREKQIGIVYRRMFIKIVYRANHFKLMSLLFLEGYKLCVLINDIFSLTITRGGKEGNHIFFRRPILYFDSPMDASRSNSILKWLWIEVYRKVWRQRGLGFPQLSNKHLIPIIMIIYQLE